MFVRTKYEIQQALPINLKGDFDENDKCILVTRYYQQWYLLKSEIIKKSDNIEELFDEVVMVNSVNKPLIIALWKDGNLKGQEKKIFIDSLKVDINVYGAIWTDKGLIYVARMNDKGEWKLL